MRKIKLKKRKKINKINIFIITLILIILIVIKVFSFINKRVTPTIMKYAEIQAKRVAILVINQAVNQEVISNLSNEDFFISTVDTNNKITSIDFNPLVINSTLSSISTNVRSYLKNLENGNIDKIGMVDNNLFNNNKDIGSGIIFYIPSGIVFNNAITSNFGPNIPVKLNLVGNVTSEIITDVKSYGINNSLIQLIVNIGVSEDIILPYYKKTIQIETNIPLAVKIIQGELPPYYYNANTIGSNITDKE